MKPIATPFDVEVALDPGREWTGDYSLDFRAVLPGLAAASAPAPAPHEAGASGGERSESEDDDAPEFSAVTGRLLQRPQRRRPQAAASGDTANGALVSHPLLGGDGSEAGTGALVAFHSPAAEALARREYKGLEVRRGETPATPAVMGQRGIAMAYRPVASQSGEAGGAHERR